MAKVPVKAEVFKFYLESYGLEPDELAQKASIAPEKVALWNSQDTDISISLLRDMANVYKKHWGIFLLDKPPQAFKKPKDYRARSSHHHFSLTSRLAFEEANRLITIAASYSLATIDDRISSLSAKSIDAKLLASRARLILGVTASLQDSWKYPEDAWAYYHDKLEELGFVISVQALDEGVDGFTVIKDDGVAIVVNSAVKNVYRRTFTLLHELGHYFQRISAACDTTEVLHEVAAENYADTFASNLLVPASIFRSQETVIEIAVGRLATENDYSTLAKKFCISMSQVAVRLFEMKLISRSILDKQLATAEKIYRETEATKKKKMKESGGFDPNGHERKAINRVGKPLASSLLTSYKADQITARDFSSMMGVKINLVGRIENMLSERK